MGKSPRSYAPTLAIRILLSSWVVALGTGVACVRSFPPSTKLQVARVPAPVTPPVPDPGDSGVFVPGPNDLFVSPSGIDQTSSGRSIAAPYRTLNYAIARLTPGARLVVRGGTYFERVTIGVSGTADAPIVIEAYPGEVPVLDSGPAAFRTPGNDDWELVNAAIGEYRSRQTFPATAPGNLWAFLDPLRSPQTPYENGRMILLPYKQADHFRSTSEARTSTTAPYYIGPGVWFENSRIHVRLAKTQAFRQAETKIGRLLPDDLSDPRQFPIYLSTADSTLDIRGSHLTLRGLTVHQAVRSVRLLSSARNINFHRMTVWSGAHGIATSGNNVNDVDIGYSRVFGDHPRWFYWGDLKSAPFVGDFFRTASIHLGGGATRWNIHHTHLRGSGQDLIATTTNERDILVQNVLGENCADDFIEIEGTVNVGRIEVANSVIRNCLTAASPGQDTPAFDGPFLFHHNVVALLHPPAINRGPVASEGWNGSREFGYEYLFKHSTGSTDNNRNTHYYQNTLILLNHSGQGMNIVPKDSTQVRIFNNVLMTVQDRVMTNYRSGTGRLIDANLYFKMFPSSASEPLLSTFRTVQDFRASVNQNLAVGVNPMETQGIGQNPASGTDPQFLDFRPRFALNSVRVFGGTSTTSVPFWTPADVLSEGVQPSDVIPSPQSPLCGRGIAGPIDHLDPATQQWVPLPGLVPGLADIGAIPCGTPASAFNNFPF